MIRPIKITLNAAHPEVPLIEATTFVGSPSAVFVSGVPATVGLWRITSVKVVAHYPDDSATTVECVKGASGVWTATLPATATSGRVTHGFEILADGLDERGDAVTGYVLGYADFAVFTRDMTIDSGGTLYYMHYFDAVPQTPKKGDVAPDGSGGLQLYNGTAWVSMGGYTPPAGGIPKTDLSEGVQASLDKADTALQSAPVTSVNSKTGAVVLNASDVGALGNTGNQTLNGNLTANNIDAQRVELYDNGLDAIGLAGNGLRNPNNDNVVINWPSLGSSDTLALVSQIYAAVQQIAPAWVSGTTYDATAKVSYNGVLYARKTSGSITSSTNPASDTTNWEAKKVSELFLPLAGGEVHDITVHTPGSYQGSIVLYTDGVDGPYIAFKDNANQYILFFYSDRILTHDGIISYPVAPGTFALLQNLAANYSTSATYALNQLCVYSNKLYRCTTAITTAEAWTAAHWTEATVEDVLAAIRTALGDKAPLASPAFTGTPTAPTPTAGDDSTKVATTAFVKNAIDGISVTPLSGNTYDFSTNADVYKAVADIARALGATVTNAPTDPVSTSSND